MTADTSPFTFYSIVGIDYATYAGVEEVDRKTPQVQEEVASRTGKQLD